MPISNGVFEYLKSFQRGSRNYSGNSSRKRFLHFILLLVDRRDKPAQDLPDHLHSSDIVGNPRLVRIKHCDDPLDHALQRRGVWEAVGGADPDIIAGIVKDSCQSRNCPSNCVKDCAKAQHGVVRGHDSFGEQNTVEDDRAAHKSANELCESGFSCRGRQINCETAHQMREPDKIRVIPA